MMGGWCGKTVAATLALAVGSAGVSGQESGPARVEVGAGLAADLVVGDASDFLDGGAGRFLFADFRLDGRGVFSLRVDASSSALADDDDQLTGAVAENDMYALIAGPQVTAMLGSSFRPYVGAFAGLAGVRWHTEVPSGPNGDLEDDGGDTAFAWGGHAGIGIVLDHGDHPVAIRFEARLVDTGVLPFARAPALSGTEPVGFIDEDVALLGARIAITLGF